MLGDFTISIDGKSISDNNNRSKKVWSFIAYLIYNRTKSINPQQLIEVFCGNSSSYSNPATAIKALIFRARAELDNLYEGAGHELIVFRNGGYSWNNSVETVTDFEQFEELENIDSSLSPERLAEILALYRGDFLKNIPAEFWTIPVATHYMNLFCSTLTGNAAVLYDNGLAEELKQFCSIASQADPFNEDLHRTYMQVSMSCGDKKGAASIYRKLSNRLLSELGVFPSEETRALYHDIIKTTNEHIISSDMLMDQLREDSDFPGALVCEYDFFRILYYSMARSVMRNGVAVHIVLLSLVGKKDSEIPKKKIEKEMDNLRDAVRNSLRRGDSAARCSVSQFVVMLPGANYENSCMVCERIIRSYNKKFSPSGTEIRYEIRPIEPDCKDNFPSFFA